MKKLIVFCLALLLLWGLVAVAGEDATTASVPKLIRISKFELKAGKHQEFSNLTRQVRQALNSSNTNYHWVAVTPIAGNTNYVEAFAFYDNFAQLEQARNAFQSGTGALMKNVAFHREAADAIAGNKAMLAKYREDLSYRPEKLDLASATAWDVEVVQLKPGYSRDFARLEKENIALHKQANIDEHWVAYEVEYGASGPTFIYLTGLKSLSGLDRDIDEIHKTADLQALRHRFDELAKQAVTRQAMNILAVRPDLSRAPQTLVAANPGFWTVKEEAPVAAKKKTKKEAMEPATLKEKN